VKVKIHTQGWIADRSKEEGEEAQASLYVLLELDGKLISEVTRVATVHSNEGFTKLVVTLIPGELETVVHDRDSWAALCQDADDPQGARIRALFRKGLKGYRRPPA
jgi:hypothetical protein